MEDWGPESPLNHYFEKEGVNIVAEGGGRQSMQPMAGVRSTGELEVGDPSLVICIACFLLKLRLCVTVDAF